MKKMKKHKKSSKYVFVQKRSKTKFISKTKKVFKSKKIKPYVNDTETNRIIAIIKSQLSGPDFRNYIGNYAEVRFLEEAAKRNFEANPRRNGAKPDATIFGYKNKFAKDSVQAKAACLPTLPSGNKAYSCRIPVTNSINFGMSKLVEHKCSQKVKYNGKEIQYFAVYITDYDRMYLIPSKILLDYNQDSIAVYDSDFTKPKFNNKKNCALDIRKYKNW